MTSLKSQVKENLKKIKDTDKYLFINDDFDIEILDKKPKEGWIHSEDHIVVETPKKFLKEMWQDKYDEELLEDYSKLGRKSVKKAKESAMLTFGKHSGQTLQEVYKVNPSYIVYLADKMPKDSLVKFKIYDEVIEIYDRMTEEEKTKKKWEKPEKKSIEKKEEVVIPENKLSYVKTSDDKYIIYNVTDAQLLKIIEILEK